MDLDQNRGPTRGSKRSAPDSEDYDHDQRLTKRFRTLSLRSDGISQRVAAPIAQQEQQQSSVDSMHLDNTKDKIYIHDLDQELEDLEANEDTIVFLPEIEKRMTTIPKSVLANSEPSSTGQEVVLYQVPSSITVPEAEDNVRRAIIETRARARTKAVEEKTVSSAAAEDTILLVTNAYDPDAMDIE